VKKSLYFVGLALCLAPISAAAQDFDWSGGYAGGYLGLQAGETNFVDHSEWFVYGAAQFDSSVISGGLVGGWNMQRNNFVFGVEADYSLSSYEGQYSDADWPAYVSSEVNSHATLRGRAGVAIDNILIFGTAGLAFMDITNSACYDEACDPEDTSATVETSSKVGLAIGAGIEYAFSGANTISLQVMSLSAPDTRIGYGTGGTREGARSNSYNEGSWKTALTEIRIGYNYHF
jgi:outer membrane immunogenic protein